MEYTMGLFGRKVKKNNKDNEIKSDSGFNSGIFNGFILLDSSGCDWNFIKREMRENWGIICDTEPENNNLVFEWNGCMVVMGYVDTPVPGEEAEINASYNYMWKEAPTVVKHHCSQIITAVMDKSDNPVEAAKLYTMMADCCLKLPNALGIYVNGTVYPPNVYCETAQDMKDGELPISCWVFIFLYQGGKGIGSYTCGLKSFGRDEIEIIDSNKNSMELFEAVYDICAYIITSGAILKDGDTLGFTEHEKTPVNRSKGIAIEEDTIKIMI